MTVTVDHQPLATEALGLRTIGQVLAHLQKASNRLVVHVLIDGQEPDLNRLGAIKQSPLNGHTLYIETAEPKRIALDALAEVEGQLDEANRLKADAVKLLQSNNTAKALEKLSGCFTTWQHAEESILKTAQLLRIDLSRILVEGRPFTEILGGFAGQLKSIRTSLENRDYVGLCDSLEFETTQTSGQWKSAIEAIRDVVKK